MAKSKKTDAPKTEKPKAIEIISVKLTRRKIIIDWRQGESTFNLSEPDNPLPGFYPAFSALSSVVGTICHFPKTYCQKGMRITEVNIGQTGGVETVSLKVKKDIDDAQKEFGFPTPTRLLAHPTQEGKYTPPLPKADAELVAEAIEQAKAYVKGQRAQGQIEFEGDDEDENGNDDGDGLPGLDDKA